MPKTDWIPTVLLVAALGVSVFILRWLLIPRASDHEAIDIRQGVDSVDTTHARPPGVPGADEQVSSLDMLPKVPVAMAPPSVPEEPEPEPAPAPAAPPETVTVVETPPAAPAKKTFYKPRLQRRSLPETRESATTTSAFVEAKDQVEEKEQQSQQAPSSQRTSSQPAQERVFRNTSGQTSVR